MALLLLFAFSPQAVASFPPIIRFIEQLLDRSICGFPKGSRIETAELVYFTLYRDPSDCNGSGYGRFCKTVILDKVSGSCREYGYTKGHIGVDDNISPAIAPPKGWSPTVTGSQPLYLVDSESGSTLYEQPQIYLRVPDKAELKEEVSFK
ncbi:hypothetical protein [Ruegeria meonggei]|uniref:hypothetical protein n=1 Tax=Ruegeria meonggei TaxID=1446476 RepID=UPI00366B617E